MHFRVSEIREVRFLDPVPAWSRDGQMAVVPYQDENGWHVIGRGYTKDPSLPVYRSSLFRANGLNPFEFTIQPEPFLSPASVKGYENEIACEDPTIIPNGLYPFSVLYSQVRKMSETEREQFGRTSGDLAVYVSLGIVIKMYGGGHVVRTLVAPQNQDWWPRPIDMCKGGEVLLRPQGEHDILFYEFGDGEVSHVAVASTDLLECTTFPERAYEAWDSRLWLDRRPDMWDSAHVSTGPIVPLRDGTYLMFYNGRGDIQGKKVWAIGEVVFDPKTLEITERSETPLITPPMDEIGYADQYIAFSSGALVEEGRVYLYHHIADRRVRCATLNAS